MSFIVIITGGIGSGKSTVTNCFARLGVPVIDTDLLARELVEKGSPALETISEHFGPEVMQPDGSLNRSNLRKRVFNNAEERRWLEGLLHPLIRKAAVGKLNDYNQHEYVLLVVPLLTEDSEFLKYADRILVVDVPEEVQVERTTARDNISIDAVKQIMATQLAREQRLMLADDVLDNSRSPERLMEKVEELNEQYHRLAQKTQNSELPHLQ